MSTQKRFGNQALSPPWSLQWLTIYRVMCRCQTPSGGRRVARSLITWEKAWKSWSEIPTPDPNIQPSPKQDQITLLGLSNEPKNHCRLTSAFKNQCSIGTLTKELVFFRNKCEWLESLHWPSFHHTPPRAKLPNLQGSQPSKAIQKFPKTIFDYETYGCQSKRLLASNEKISKFGIPKNLRLTSNRELPGVKDRQRWTSISLSPSAQRSALLAKNLTLHCHQEGSDKVVNLHLLCKRFSFRSKPHNQFQKRIFI